MNRSRLIDKLAVSLCCCFFAIISIKAQTSRFFSPAFFELSNYLTAQVVADFNGYGIADVATSNGFYLGEADILFGNGDGNVGETQPYELGGSGPAAIAAADCNRDGT